MTRRRLFLAVVLVLWGLVTHGMHAGSGDEPHYLAIAHSIAFDLDFDLGNNYGTDEPLLAGGTLGYEDHTRPGRDGVRRPVHDVGMPILFAPYTRLMAPLAERSIPHASSGFMRRLRLTPTTLYRHLLSAAMILLSAWLAVEMSRAFATAGIPSPVSEWWALLIALSPPLLVMSVLFFTEMLSALLCLLVFRVVIREGGLDNPRQALGAGLLTGLLLLIHARNAGLVAGLLILAALALTRHRPRAPLLAFAAGFTLLFAVRTAVTYRFWGTLVTSPHARVGDWPGAGALLAEMATRAGGLLLDQEFGLLTYAPIFALVPLGIWSLSRTRPRLVAGVGVVAGAYLLAVLLPLTNAHGWTGGWSPAARFLVPILPLLGLTVPAGARLLPRTGLIVVIVIQVSLNAYLWQNPKKLWNDGDGVAAVCHPYAARLCRYLPSFVGS